MSWNALGLIPNAIRTKTGKYVPKMKPGDIGKAWSAALTANKCLLHLDLSFNKIDQDDTKFLAADLHMNQTLYGFHY